VFNRRAAAIEWGYKHFKKMPVILTREPPAFVIVGFLVQGQD